MASSSQQTGQTQQTQTAPWAPAQGGLQNILSKLQGINTNPNAAQSNALNQIFANAGSLPNFGGAATSAVGGLLNGVPNLNQFALNNYNTLSNTLSPYTSPDYLDPTKTPGIQDALQYIKNDVTNQVNGQFAGAGRDMSPANTNALAYGIGSAEAPYLFNQYNQNVNAQQGAAGSLFNAGSGTAGGLLGNVQAGTGLAGSIPGLTNMSPLEQLQAQNLKFSLPLSQLGSVEGLTLPIAGLGGTSSGTSQGQTTFNPSILQSMAMLGGNSGAFPGLNNKVLGAGLGLFG